MAIRANLSIEGFPLDQAYCRIATAELRKAGDGLVCDCVVDILSGPNAATPIQKRVFRDLKVTDGGGGKGVRAQLYGHLKGVAMFAGAEDA